MARARRNRIVQVRLRHVVIAIAVGSAVNVGLAIHSAYRYEPIPPTWHIRVIEVGPSLASTLQKPGLVVNDASAAKIRSWRVGAQMEWETQVAHERGTQDRYELYIRRDGWPWVALEQRQLVVYYHVPPPSRQHSPEQALRYQELRQAPRQMTFHGSFEVFRRRVPYVPVWPGFVANTLVFAPIAFPCVVLPGTLIRWRRARRGGCVACAYDIRGLATCPECGAAPSSA